MASPSNTVPIKPLNEFLPLLLIWEDDAIIEHLNKYQHGSLADFFQRAADHGILNANVEYRCINLRQLSDRDPIETCHEILKASAARFETDEFVTTFNVETESGNMEKFNVEKITERTDWFQACAHEITRSPRLSNLRDCCDIPSGIISFTIGPPPDVDIINKVFTRDKISALIKQRFGQIHTNYQISLKDDSIEFVNFRGGKTCDLTDRSSEVDAAFYGQMKSKQLTISNNLLDTLMEINREVVKKMKTFLSVNIKIQNEQIEENSKRKQSFHIFGRKEKLRNAANEFNTAILRLVCDSLALNERDNARALMTRLLPVPDADYEELVQFIQYSIFISDIKGLSDNFSAVKPFFTTSKLEIVEKHVMLIELIDIVCHCESSHDKTMRQLVKIIRNADQAFDDAIRAVCFERMAGHCLKSERKKKRAIVYLYYAFEIYQNLQWRGHAIRCAAFIQNILANLENRKDSFICGRADTFMNLTKPAAATGTRWSLLMYRTLSSISRLLRECNQVKLVMLISMYLLCYDSSDTNESQCHAKDFFDVVNRRTGWDLLKNFTIPIITIGVDTQVFPYGSAESLGIYNDARFSDILKVWQKKTRSRLFSGAAGSTWKGKEVSKFDHNIVCHEKVSFRIPIKKPQHISWIFLTEMHVNAKVSDVTPEKYDIWVPSRDANEIEWIQRRPLSNPVTREVRENPIEEFTTSTRTDSRTEEIVTMGLTSHAPVSFSVSELAFTAWGPVNFTIPIPEFHFKCFANEPILEPVCEDFPTFLYESEVRDFTVVLRNIGDACMGRVSLVHDSRHIITFEPNDQELKDGLTLVPIITEKDDGIRPNEEIQFKGRIRGQSESFEIRLVWFFEAQKPFNWRYYCQKFVVKVDDAQTVHSRILIHPESSVGKIVFADVAATDEDVTITGATLHGVKYHVKPLREGETSLDIIPANSKKGVILEQDAETDADQQEQPFVNPEISSGLIFGSVASSPIPFHHLLPAEPRREFSYDLIVPSEVVVQDDFELVEAVFKMKNMTETVKYNVVVEARPLSNGARWSGLSLRLIEQLKPSEVMTLNFKLMVMKPGIINVAMFSIQHRGNNERVPFNKYLTVKTCL